MLVRAARATGAGGADAEVREDLIDHGPLRDKGDDSHGTVAGRARVRVDFEVLLQEHRPRRARRDGACDAGYWRPAKYRVVRCSLSERYVTALAVRSKVRSERDGIPGAVVREPRRKCAIVLGDPSGGVLRRYPTAEAYSDDVSESSLLTGVHHRCSLDARKAMGVSRSRLAVVRYSPPSGR